MSAPPTRRGRGGLGKYLRARGRRGTGRPAEFGKRLLLEDEEEKEDEEGEEGEGGEEDNGRNEYAKRQLGTNADRYEEPEVDPHAEEEPEPEVDLSSFLARQRLADQDDHTTYNEGDEDGVDHSLSNLPSASSFTSNTRKNKAQTIEWDASMDELKREKETAEAIWDLKSRFRKYQPRLAASAPKHSSYHEREPRAPSKLEDSRHVYKPPDPGANFEAPTGEPNGKADMEDFLDDLLS